MPISLILLPLQSTLNYSILLTYQIEIQYYFKCGNLKLLNAAIGITKCQIIVTAENKMYTTDTFSRILITQRNAVHWSIQNHSHEVNFNDETSISGLAFVTGETTTKTLWLVSIQKIRQPSQPSKKETKREFERKKMCACWI